MDSFTRAATNRSIRTIQTELEFLQDAEVLTAAQVSSIQSILDRTSTPNPAAAVAAAPLASGMSALAITPSSAAAAVTSQKKTPTPAPRSPSPPAYADDRVATAVALYAYAADDDGDVALQPGDRVAVLEYANDDWAKGRNERTGRVGIFPRSYVREEAPEKAGVAKGGVPPPPARAPASAYGQLEGRGQEGGMVEGGQPQGDSKAQEQGKKFGKKLGNAAIFGAGATMGSKIVNGIF